MSAYRDTYGATPPGDHYILPPAPAWWAKAACHGQTHLLALFFPTEDARKRNPRVPIVIRELCTGCPVAGECLADALADDPLTDDGIRAGTTAAERRRLRARELAEAG